MEEIKFTAIPVYDSKETPELRMTVLVDKYFETKSKTASQLDFKDEVRSFAFFLRSNYTNVSEINIDPVDAIDSNTVRALFLAGVAMLVDNPNQRGGEYMSNPYKKEKRSIIHKFKTTVRKWSKNSNEQTLKAVYASILDVAGMVPPKLLVCKEVSTFKKVLRFLLGSVAASRNLVATALSGVAGIFGQTTATTVEEYVSVLEDPSLPIVLQMVLSKVSKATDTMHRVCNACFLYFITQITDMDHNKIDLLFDIRYMYPIM